MVGYVNGYFATKCIICKEILVHQMNGHSFNRIAHTPCRKAILALKSNNIRKFAGVCMIHNITNKALYKELVNKKI